MAESLSNIVSSPVTYKVFSEGQQIPETVVVKSIVVSKLINRVSFANIILYDGGVADSAKFESSTQGLFDPGKKIEIQAGYSSNDEICFKGIVTRHGLKVSKSGGFMLSIDCKDEAVKLTIGRKNALFIEKTDSDIISEVLSNYSDITSTVDSTSYTNPELIQNYTSDWDFIMQRVELNGLVMFNSDNELKITAPEIGSAVLDISPGSGLIAFNAYIDARNHVANVKAASWDRENQEVLFEESSSEPENPGGSLSMTDLSNVIGLETFNLQTTSSIPSEVLQQWAAAKHIKTSFSKIQGSITIGGYPALKLGDVLNLSDLSDQFNGPLFVGGFEHIIEDGEFTTIVKLGIESNFFSEEKRDIPAPGASGLLSPMKGLHIGVVEQIHEDDNGEFRIKVKLPSLQVDNLSVWARQSNFYATAEAGLFFYPEVNDEVIVGFLNEDPQSPIILGSLYNKNNSTPAYQPTEDNYIKALVTKTGLTIEFDEENNAITFKTPEEQTITMNDTDSIISISDMNDNIVEMSADGIKVTSPGDIIFEADGDIKIEAGGDIITKATGDLKGEGMNVEFKGQTKFAAEGAMTEVKGSGQTTIEGGIVMIN